MLYVFIVTSGDMIQLDMNLAVKKVSELKKEISKFTNFPVDDQVLLCSGGEELLSDNMVGNYHGAGTDTNPIFLFRKSPIKPEKPTHQPECKLDSTISVDVKACASMAPSMQALSVRSNLAQRFADCALKGKKDCNILVHHQHLQQQGWAVVIANLEDAKDALIKRKQDFDDIFQKYLTNRSSYKDILASFEKSVEMLSKIPLLEKLIVRSECSDEDLATEHTLLSWFCTEPQEVLRALVEKCQMSVDELDEHSMIVLNEDLRSILKRAEHPDFKELKGIGERLTVLSTQKLTAESYEKDQSELCKGFFNQAQIQHARDPNILPDICKTFQNQLELMLDNHKCLEDILTKCIACKTELCIKLQAHVGIVCHLENDMYDLQVRIIFLKKHVKSVMNKIESFHQVKMAPERYLKMLAEVCRRKEFSRKYIKWAVELSTEVSKLYHKELAVRKKFGDETTKNMVDNLFPGMDDEPPLYAVECPPPFDQNLPDITKEDLEWMKSLLPDLAIYCEVLPIEPMPHICQAESDSAFSSNIPSSLKIKFMQELHSIRSILMDLKIFVKDEMSEKMLLASDVLEKINSYSEKFQDQLLQEKEIAINEVKKEFTSIENAYISRLEVESQKLCDAEQQISHYEEHLREVTSNFEEVKLEKDELMFELQEKGDSIKKMMLEHEIEFDSVKNQMKDVLQKQDSKIVDLQEALCNANCEIDRLRTGNEDTQLECDKKVDQFQETFKKLQEEQNYWTDKYKSWQSPPQSMSEVMEGMEIQLSEAIKENIKLKKKLEEADERISKTELELQHKEKITDELKEKLITEVESVHAQYQLAVNITPKDKTANEQKVPNQEPNVNEDAKSSLESGQEEVKDLELLQQVHEEALEKLKSRMTAENQVSFNEAINRLAKEKDSTIEDLKSQISHLEATLTAIKHSYEKYFLSNQKGLAMSQSLGASRSCYSFSQSEEYQLIIKLQREIEPLLKSLTTQHVQISQHSLECQKKKFKSKELEYQRIISKCIKLPGTPKCFECCTKLSILTCEKDDLVLLCYDEKYRNFIIFHLGPFVHFLHTDSMQALNLKIPTLPSVSAGSSRGAQSSELSSKSLEPSQRWAIGVVEDKEFCITKKKENRYNVPIGTKFHRVKVRPWDREAGSTIHQCHRSFQMGATSASVSKSVSGRSPSDDGDGPGSSRDMSASSI